jgi:hypothetical protein
MFLSTGSSHTLDAIFQAIGVPLLFGGPVILIGLALIRGGFATRGRRDSQ